MQAIGWEYCTIPAEDDDRLNELGRDGWELVGVGCAAHPPVLYFKRPRPTFGERVTLEQRETYYAAIGLAPTPDSDKDQE